MSQITVDRINIIYMQHLFLFLPVFTKCTEVSFAQILNQFIKIKAYKVICLIHQSCKHFKKCDKLRWKINAIVCSKFRLLIVFHVRLSRCRNKPIKTRQKSSSALNLVVASCKQKILLLQTMFSLLNYFFFALSKWIF